jgi:hypothetical protein
MATHISISPTASPTNPKTVILVLGDERAAKRTRAGGRMWSVALLFAPQEASRKLPATATHVTVRFLDSLILKQRVLARQQILDPSLIRVRLPAYVQIRPHDESCRPYASGVWERLPGLGRTWGLQAKAQRPPLPFPDQRRLQSRDQPRPPRLSSGGTQQDDRLSPIQS